MQAKDWIRWDSKFAEHPSAVAMDWRGHVYFWQLCCISKRYSFTGEVPHAYAFGAYVASKLRGMEVAAMDAGREQVTASGLVNDDGETLTIRNWLKWQSMTDAERSKKYRTSKKASQPVTETPSDRDERHTASRPVTSATHKTETETETETKKEPPNGGMSSKPDPLAGMYGDVFDYWKEVMGHPNAKLTADRKTKMRARFAEKYTVDDCKDAIDGCKASTHHMGQNDRNTVYDDLKRILATGGDLERFKGYLTNKPEQHSGVQDDGIYREFNEDKELF